MKLISLFLMISVAYLRFNKVVSIPLYPYDDKGCCISCGYTYCDTLLECVRPWEVECPKLINPFINDDNNFILDNNNEVGSI